MYSMSNLVFALIIGGGIGGVVGWYLALNARGDNKRKVIMDLKASWIRPNKIGLTTRRRSLNTSRKPPIFCTS